MKGRLLEWSALLFITALKSLSDAVFGINWNGFQQALLLLMLLTTHAIDATFLTETALDRIVPVLPREFVLIPLMQGR